MKLVFLIIIITLITSIKSYDYKLENGSQKNIGTLFKGTTYSFYLDAKTGQEATIIFTSSSIEFKAGTPSITVYSYKKGQSSYSKKNEYDMVANGNTLSMKFDVKYIINNSENNLISYIIYEFTPIYEMQNTQVLAEVHGTSIENVATTVGALIIIIILIPIIICISIIVCIICCCCCQKSPKPVVYVPVNQPLYPAQPQPYQQPPVYVSPYP